MDLSDIFEHLNSVTAIPIVPYKNGKIDTAGHRKNIRYLMDNNHLDGGRKRVISVAGTSLIHHLKPEEQIELIDIAGQEMGTKSNHLKFAAKGKFEPQKILMIGDAPGDQLAATENGALFFPINPSQEEASWERLHNEGLNHFFAGTFTGDYQQQLIHEFEDCLPKKPDW